MKLKVHDQALLLLTCIAAVLSANAAAAKGLNPTHLPRDAKWVVHVDFEAITDSQLLQKAKQKNPSITNVVNRYLQDRYGVDPTRGLFSLTMFSRDYREFTGTAILQADYDAQKVKQQLQKAKQHRTTPWNDYTLHTVTLSTEGNPKHNSLGDETVTLVLYDKNTLLIGSLIDNAKAGVKLLAGNSQSLQGKDSPLLTERATTAWIYGAAVDLKELQQHGVAMPVLVQHEKITWAFGKQDEGQLFEHAGLVARSEAVAKKMHSFLKGVVAYETLWAEGSKPMIALMKNVKVSRDGKTVRFQWQGPTDQTVAALDAAYTRINTWKPLLLKHKTMPYDGKKK